MERKVFKCPKLTRASRKRVFSSASSPTGAERDGPPKAPRVSLVAPLNQVRNSVRNSAKGPQLWSHFNAKLNCLCQIELQIWDQDAVIDFLPKS